jgi:hypothetical protein
MTKCAERRATGLEGAWLTKQQLHPWRLAWRLAARGAFKGGGGGKKGGGGKEERRGWQRGEGLQGAPGRDLVISDVTRTPTQLCERFSSQRFDVTHMELHPHKILVILDTRF